MLVLLLMLAALILFLLSTFGVGARFNLQSAGLACLTLAFLIQRGVL